MKIAAATVLLLTASSSSALQQPIRKAFGVAAATAAIGVGHPLAAPAAVDTAVVVNVNTDGIDPIEAAKNVFARRSQLVDAGKDFLAATKTIQQDLKGVFPAIPEASLAVPADWKQAVKDALAGQGRLEVNGEPIYVEIDAKEGFYTFKVVSPILPQLPFLDPTPEQAASMMIPRAVTTSTTPVVAKETAASIDSPFWAWSFNVPVVNKAVTLAEATEIAAGIVAAAYVSTFAYYVADKALGEAKQQKKMAENKKKAAEKKAAAAAKKAEIDSTMTKEVTSEMKKVASSEKTDDATPVEKKGLKEKVFGKK